METTITCPRCNNTQIVKNGNTHYGKQNYKCKHCHRQFVLNGNQWFISEEKKQCINRLLLERLSLRGICRAVQINMTWLMHYMVSVYEQVPENLGFHFKETKTLVKGKIYLKLLEIEADEMWSFVGEKSNKQWIWIAMDKDTRQIIAVHVGDRSEQSALALWNNIPEEVKANSVFHTDDWDPYKGVIPSEKHAYSKRKKFTNHIERFNNTMRQRVSRLVRKALSFSKKLENHIGAIKYFICDYNKLLHLKL